MADDSPRSSKAPPMSRNPRVGFEWDRRHHPHRFVTPDSPLIFVENVAHMLGCGVDQVRRIPRHELPAAKVGQRVVYVREDVVSFVRRCRDHGTASAAPVHPGARTTLTAPARRGKAQKALAAPATIDPVGEVRRLLSKGRDTP